MLSYVAREHKGKSAKVNGAGHGSPKNLSIVITKLAWYSWAEALLNPGCALAGYRYGIGGGRGTEAVLQQGISMKRGLFRVLGALLGGLGIVAGLTGFIAPAHAEKRVALVVGNDNYKNIPKLLKAVNDAHTMGETLKRLGFTVMVAENLSRPQFSEALLAFDKAIGPGDTAFFFYSGHGFEIAGQNFLLPTDVPVVTEGQEELVRDSSILADRIVERLQNRGARTSILVFDACRNNPFERAGIRSIGGGGGLAPMTQLPEGVFSVFSAGPRQIALDRLSNDDANPNSVFTRVFAKELLRPGENLVQVAQRTRRSVSELAESVKHKQVPVYFDQMVDDVFLSGKAEGTVVNIDTAKPAAEPSPQKIAALPPVPHVPKEAVKAPTVAFERSDHGGWYFVPSIADRALGISWRMGDTGDFHETGIQVYPGALTLKPAIKLPDDVQAGIIEVRYVDGAGEMRGPFPIKFDPEAAQISIDRRGLEWEDGQHWLKFVDYSGELLVYYVTPIMSRCAIREMHVGIDTAVPDKVVKLPPCDIRDPTPIPKGAQTNLKLPPQTRFVSVKLLYRDGSASEIKTFRR